MRFIPFGINACNSLIAAFLCSSDVVVDSITDIRCFIFSALPTRLVPSSSVTSEAFFEISVRVLLRLAITAIAVVTVPTTTPMAVNAQPRGPIDAIRVLAARPAALKLKTNKFCTVHKRADDLDTAISAARRAAKSLAR